MAQRVKNPPVMQETWLRSLGQEDPLEKEMTSHFSIPAWRSPWAEEPGGLWCHKEPNTTEQLTYTHTHLYINSRLLVYPFWNL